VGYHVWYCDAMGFEKIINDDMDLKVARKVAEVLKRSDVLFAFVIKVVEEDEQ
jgi:hypothetical protein